MNDRSGIAGYPARRLLWTVVGLWAVVSAALVGGAVHLRSGLHEEVRTRMIGRAAAVLSPLVQSQVELAVGEATAGGRTERLVQPMVTSARQKGLLARAGFDADGLLLVALPQEPTFVELPMDDFFRLQSEETISRYHPAFDLARLPQGGAAGLTGDSPVLEVLIALHQAEQARPIGFARYHFDARPLSAELGAIDRQMRRQTWAVAGGGWLTITAVFGLAYLGLRRAGRAIERGNANLARAERNLTLSAKASALGQITSHLMHGLQGSVAGLHAAVGVGGGAPDWTAAQEYTRRMEALVGETMALLTDQRTALVYDLAGPELAELIARRNAGAARDRSVALEVECRFAGRVDNVRGSLVCLITSNLVHNAIAVSGAGQSVRVVLREDPGRCLHAEVTDHGPGVPEALRARLFEPGCSGRAGGTGLGLAISRLLALQIGGELTLAETGPSGSRFCLSVPLAEPVSAA